MTTTAGIRTTPSWVASESGGPRLPGGRERRPALAALAVLLIALGALASAVLVLRSGHKSSVLEITTQVPAGHTISSADLTSIQVSASGVQVIPVSQADQIEGHLQAAATLEPGTLLTPQMLTSTGTPSTGQATVAVDVKGGQVPGGTDDGNIVEVLTTSASASSTSGGAPVVLAPTATVYSVRGDGSDGYLITLVVPQNEAPAIAVATTVALVKLPGGQ